MKIKFGKYRNQELSKVYEDTNYKNWLLSQSFFKEKYHDEYQYLLKYKPLSPINFNDLPSDIKSKIFKINYDSDKKEKQEKYKKEIEDNIKRRQDFQNRRRKYYKGFRCECGKRKKPEYWTCYSCYSNRLSYRCPIYMKWNYDMCGCPI